MSRLLVRRSSRPTKRSSRPNSLARNAGVERRKFGKAVDPDKVKARDLDAAMDRFETFQQKPPQDVVRVEHDPPASVIPVGDCLSVMYRSGKWYEDKDVDYKHRHGPTEQKDYAPGKGVRLYENARFASAAVKKNGAAVKLPRSTPDAWTRLGYCLGLFVRKDEDGEVYECNPRNTWLLSAPDGHMLAIYSPKPQSDGSVGFLCVMAGGKLRVLKEGIDG